MLYKGLPKARNFGRVLKPYLDSDSTVMYILQ